MYLYIASTAVRLLTLLLFMIGAYYLAVAVFSFFPRRYTEVDNVRHRFAVLIPAHNEEKVLPGLIKSIRRANYPQQLISIYVVADGCTDRTVQVAERMGAAVTERPIAVRKGDALSDGLSYIQSNDAGFDCAAVFDADNIVDENFFERINDRILLGAEAVQGYVDARNPERSWIANSYSMWYWITNRTIQTGRAKLNFGCRLNGTGFVLTKNILAEIPWLTTTEAEDSEYTCRLAERGVKVDFAEDAVVYDEKPETFSVSVRQRRRWARGMFDVQSEYTLRLITKRRFNAVMGLWGDILFPLVFAVIFVSVLFGKGAVFCESPAAIFTAWLYIFANIAVAVLALVRDGKLGLKAIPDIFGFLIYIVSWLPIGFFGIFGRKDGWYHTKHGENT